MSNFRFKRFVPGGFNLGFIGSTCNASPWTNPLADEDSLPLFPLSGTSSALLSESVQHFHDCLRTHHQCTFLSGQAGRIS